MMHSPLSHFPGEHCDNCDWEGRSSLMVFAIPVKAVSTANLREHWAKKSKRTASQRSSARLCCPRWGAGPILVVRLTRVSPRQLDSDNLASALKAVRDGVADWLRIDDGSPLVRWEYGQEQGADTVRVEVVPA